MIDIKKAEKYFYNSGYADIINEAKPFGAHFSTRNVWGNEVIWLDVSNPDKVTQKRYKLKRYCVDAEIGKDDADINAIEEKLVNSLTAKNYEMFGGVIDAEKLLDLTCNQPSEWQWLQDENGKIFRETHKNGDVVYTARLVKYAVILDANGNPIDPEIKEIR